MRRGEERTRAFRARDQVLQIDRRCEETQTDARASLAVELLHDADAIRERTGEDTNARSLLDRDRGIDVGDRGRAARTQRRRKDRAAWGRDACRRRLVLR